MGIMLSKKAKYALEACLALARATPGVPVMIAEVAQAEGIPKKFLELILLDLKNGGLLHSKKGKGGGYMLAKPPRQITMGQIIRLVEGPLALVPCVSQTAYQKCEDCHDERLCGIRMVMRDVRDQTARILDNASLADVLERVAAEQSAAEGGFDYSI